MNLIATMYDEGQERRNRLMELAKYMQWRLLPRHLRVSMRKYLNFVWDCNESVGETEELLMQKLSPTLRSKLSLHIFGGVLKSCPFLSWMVDEPLALQKLARKASSCFYEANDMLF